MTTRISRPAIASTVGTALEWYDFSLYASAAAIVLPYVFFPQGDPTAATLSSLATFAVGFLARPLGGVLIGVLGDRVGRRAMLFATLLVMAASSTAIGLLPGYATAGVLAPVLLVALRVVQGLGAGGEYAGALLMSTEHAPARARGLNAALPTLGNAVGALAATGALALASTLPRDQFLDWGWRIPFLLSVLVGAAGVLIRLRVPDSPAFRAERAARTVPPAPLRELFARARHRIGPAMLVSIAPNVISYLPSVYALTYLARNVGAPDWVGLLGVVVANVCKLVTVPTAGWLCDRIGRRPVMTAGALGAAVLFYPFFLMLDTGTPIVVWAAFVLVYALVNDLTLASQATMLAEQFEVRYRYTGVTFSREIVGAVVGGCIPFLAAALDAWSGRQVWPIVAVSAGLCLLSALGARLVAVPEDRLPADATGAPEPAPR